MREGERSDQVEGLIIGRKPDSSPDTAAEGRKVEAVEKQRMERKPQGWKCMPYVIGNETFEKLASSGLMTNLAVYLVNEFHMEQVKVTNVVNIFFGTSNFAPLIGAFISDAYLGRFYTLAFTSIISFMGIVALTLSASLPQLRPPKCPDAAPCPAPSPRHLAPLYFSMALLVIGAAGIRPCSLPFGVDQFDRSTHHGRQSLNSFFNWYYFSTAVSLFVSMTALVYVQNSISWAVGFGVPAVLMLLAVILFFVGIPLYICVAPEGSVLSGIGRVFVAAFRKRRLRVPAAALLYNPPPRNDRIAKLPLTLQLRCLNKAAVEIAGEVSPEDGSLARPWRLCSVQQVEEVKCLIRIIPIWFSGVLWFTALSQQWTFIVLQSMKMDRHIGRRFAIPPAAVSPINLFGMSIFLPIYDRVLVPALRRLTKQEQGITLLQRQGVGLFLSVVSMVMAAAVEWKRKRETAMSVLWLVPQLMVMGVSEAFTAVGEIEFYNREFPEHLQTLGGSLFFLSLAGANYLSLFLVWMVRKVTGGEGRKSWLENDLDEGKLDYYYYLIAVLGMMNFLYFLVCARFYRYKGTAVDEEDDGKRAAVEEGDGEETERSFTNLIPAVK